MRKPSILICARSSIQKDVLRVVVLRGFLGRHRPDLVFASSAEDAIAKLFQFCPDYIFAYQDDQNFLRVIAEGLPKVHSIKVFYALHPEDSRSEQERLRDWSELENLGYDQRKVIPVDPKHWYPESMVALLQEHLRFSTRVTIDDDNKNLWRHKLRRVVLPCLDTRFLRNNIDEDLLDEVALEIVGKALGPFEGMDVHLRILEYLSSEFNPTLAIRVSVKLGREARPKEKFVKIGPYKLLKNEYDTFYKYVRNQFPQHVCGYLSDRPQDAFGIVGAMVADYIPYLKGFAELFHLEGDKSEVGGAVKSATEVLTNAIVHLFKVLRDWDDSDPVVKDVDLDQLPSFKHVPFRKDLDKKLTESLGVFPTESANGRRLNIVGLSPDIANPVSLLQSYPNLLRVQTRFRRAHGDLVTHHIGIGVGESCKAYVFDFSRVCDEHFEMCDFVRLESSVRFELLGIVDLDSWFQMETEMFDWWGTELAWGFDTSSKLLSRALAMIGTIRNQALLPDGISRGRASDSIKHEYRVGLLANALDFVTWSHLPKNGRQRALVSASLLAERLTHEPRPVANADSQASGSTSTVNVIAKVVNIGGDVVGRDRTEAK